ncbi:major facilitator superfamily domain-containing protein [Aspergillus venezuelensis]
MSTEPAKIEVEAGPELGQNDSGTITTITTSPDWMLEEERRAGRKTDLTILPLLTLGMITFQFDRMNLASALTNNFASDISVTQNTINLGNQLMFLGFILLEIPSKIALQRVGASKWISAQVFIFGLIATMQIFLKDRAGFLASRLMLDLAEAGRRAVLFFGMFGGNAVSPLLGAEILRLDGRGGLRGWQFIFLIEGVMTMVVALLLLLVLPTSPQRPRPLFFKGVVRFSERESPLTTYTPSFIMSVGLTRIQANALSAIGASLTLPLVFVFATISGKTKRKGLTVIAATTCYLIVLIVARCILGTDPGPNKWTRFGLWTVINAFAVRYHPVHSERSIAISMWVMSAISGLLVGTQILRGEDSPTYLTGLIIMIALVSSGLALAILQEVIYLFLNARQRRKGK